MSSQQFISISQADVTISHQPIVGKLDDNYSRISYYTIKKSKLVINTKGFFFHCECYLKSNILVTCFLTSSLQNQPFAGVIQNICSLKLIIIFVL